MDTPDELVTGVMGGGGVDAWDGVELERRAGDGDVARLVDHARAILLVAESGRRNQQAELLHPPSCRSVSLRTPRQAPPQIGRAHV